MVKTIKGLQELQEKFCMSIVGGEVRVIDRDQIRAVLAGEATDAVHYYRKPDGELLMKRLLESLPIASKPKETIREFWISPNTLVIDAVAFDPTPQPETTLNYYVGHTVAPCDAHIIVDGQKRRIEGDWAVIKDYLLNVICDGNYDAYEYLGNFLAHMIQKPEIKPGIIIILMGGEGVGKGVFFQLLARIWSRTTLLISDVNEIVGNFNASLESHFIVCMDEALFKGDKKAQDKLKSIVTEPTIRIEEKYQPKRTIKSYHRFFASTNDDQFAKIRADDRRCVFLRVSDREKQNTDYFSKLVAAFHDGETVEAFVHFLSRCDFDNFDIRKRPRTDEHDLQKVLSLKGFPRYWREVLEMGDFTICTGTYLVEKKWDEGRFVSSSSILEGYNAFDKQSGKYEPVQMTTITKSIKQLCPSADITRRRGEEGNKRGVQLPPLEIARLEFEEYLGGKVDWDA
jgi:hypothetical protein